MADQFATIDDYIGSFPDDVQVVLEEIRRTLHRAVPAADEAISYQMPAVTLNGRYLAYFAGWKHHVSLYPLPEVDQALAQELAPYRAGKGTARFPIGQPVPYDLIGRLVALLVEQRSGGK
jgi:uncharacterized protein YdhG (YjbR/CyaY superfamily)